MQRVSNVNNAINKKRCSCFNITSFNRFRFYRLPLTHKFDCGVRALKCCLDSVQIAVQSSFFRLKINSMTNMYRVRHKKSNPLDLLAVFSATAGNFKAKFHTLIYLSLIHI